MIEELEKLTDRLKTSIVTVTREGVVTSPELSSLRKALDIAAAASAQLEKKESLA
jgi:hypothetical protein